MELLQSHLVEVEVVVRASEAIRFQFLRWQSPEHLIEHVVVPLSPGLVYNARLLQEVLRGLGTTDYTTGEGVWRSERGVGGGGGEEEERERRGEGVGGRGKREGKGGGEGEEAVRERRRGGRGGGEGEEEGRERRRGGRGGGEGEKGRERRRGGRGGG